MKKALLFAALGLVCASSIVAQEGEKKEKEGYIFTTVKENPITSVKNQSRAGTCWCYSGLSFIESELLRMGKGFTRKGNNETVISVRQTVICVCGLRLVPVIFALDIEGLIIHRQNK